MISIYLAYLSHFLYSMEDGCKPRMVDVTHIVAAHLFMISVPQDKIKK